MGGNNDSCDTFADRPASPNAKTDRDALADADAAPDSITCGNREGGTAAYRPARVRVCGHTRAGDRGDRRGGGEEQKAKETRSQEVIKRFVNRSL